MDAMRHCHEMQRVDTAFVLAGVVNHPAVGDLFAIDRVRQAMRFEFATVQVQLAVTRCTQFGEPRPSLVVPTPINSIPEQFFDHAAHRTLTLRP
jgi:hypothetical protein